MALAGSEQLVITGNGDVVDEVMGLLSPAAGLLGLGGILRYVRGSTARGELGRNGAIGIRTRVTKSSDLAWDRGHRAAGPWLLAASWAGFVAGIATSAMIIAGIITELPALAGLIVAGIGFATVFVLGLLAGKKANEAGRAAQQESADQF